MTQYQRSVKMMAEECCQSTCELIKTMTKFWIYEIDTINVKKINFILQKNIFKTNLLFLKEAEQQNSYLNKTFWENEDRSLEYVLSNPKCHSFSNSLLPHYLKRKKKHCQFSYDIMFSYHVDCKIYSNYR